MPDLTAIQKSWDDAGKNYPVSATEGSLYPFDDSSMSGWCGEDSAGDRVTFLMFDISDFDSLHYIFAIWVVLDLVSAST